jgi:hypothetical protein
VLQKVLNSYVSLAVVVEVRVDEAYPVSGQNGAFLEKVHQQGVQSHWLREESQVELHVRAYGCRVEAPLGPHRPVCLLEESGIVGGDAQDAARKDAVSDSTFDCVINTGPVIG